MSKVGNFTKETLKNGAKVCGGHRVKYVSEDKEFIILLTSYGYYYGIYLTYESDGAHVDPERTPRQCKELCFMSLEECMKHFKVGEFAEKEEKAEVVSIKQPNYRKQFEDFKKKHPNAILLFKAGEHYECYEEDAEEVSKVLALPLITKGESKLAMFPHHTLDVYLPKLVRTGHKVAIVDQLEYPKLTKKLVKKEVVAKQTEIEHPDNKVEMLSLTETTGTQDGMRAIIAEKCKELGKPVERVSIWQHNGNGDFGIAVGFNGKTPVAVAPWERTRNYKSVTYQFLDSFTPKYDNLKKRVM